MNKLEQTTSLKDVQLTLPLDLIDQPVYKDIIKQNWSLTFSHQVMTSVYTKRTIALVIAQMKEEGDMREFYQIRAIDIIRQTGLDRSEVYKHMRLILRELIGVCFMFESKDDDIIIPRHLVDTTRFKNPVGYENGVLTVAFNPTLRDVIMELSHYSQYELDTYMRFSSWYSMRLWEILYAFRDKAYIEFDIENYRNWMGCGAIINDKTGEPKRDKDGKIKYAKYPGHSDMIDKTTREPLKEFEGTLLDFTVEAIKGISYGKGRPPIEKIRFNLKYHQRSISEKIKIKCEENEEFKRVYERLKKYSVSDENVVKYTFVIGKKRLNELLYQWDLRQQGDSKNKIDNPLAFCNKVIIEEGKKVLEKQLTEKGG
jgi:Initiator Replication protein